jgi:anti-sigma regulatory factor (Ser/Thr protein kinase)
MWFFFMPLKTFYLESNKYAQQRIRDIINTNISNYVDDENIFNIQVALGEAIQNIIRHAYKFADNRFIKIEFSKYDVFLEFNLYDDALPCEPALFMDKVSHLPSEKGGMGINMIKKLTYKFKIYPLEQGNRTQLIFKI